MVSRRRFLTFAAGSAGAAAGLQVLPPAIRDALAIPAAVRSGTIGDVQHVVVLMQENRSFDHYFGAMRGVRGFADPRPAPLPGGRNVWQQPRKRGEDAVVLPYRLDTRDTAALCMEDIDHGWKGAHEKWKDYDAWIEVKGERCMGHFAREELPFYYALADAFTVCDGYYCSIHGPTNPNRMHLFTGSSGLTVGDTGKQVVDNADDGNWKADMALDKPTFAGHAWTTYAQRLQQAGVDWRIYQEYDNFGDNALAYFAHFRKLSRDSQEYRRARAWVPGTDANTWQASRGESLVAAFAEDVRRGTLPQVSWIVAPEVMTEHPGAEVAPAYGQSLTARLLEALAANPEVWSKTVFILNYDENGGFFDHVPPPLPAIRRELGLSTVSTEGEDHQGTPVGLGVRTPTLVVSPWSRGGWVNSQVFDHTSVLRFLEQRFGVAEPNIGAWRRAVTGDLTSCFDFADPNRAWPKLPATRGYIDEQATAACRARVQPSAPLAQQLPQQERGGRPARALPYALQVHARVAHAQHAGDADIELRFDNTGAAGAGLTVYTPNHGDGPRYYTLEAGKHLADTWPSAGDGYDLHVHGPNGFVREFAGGARGGAQPEVEAIESPDQDALLLRLRNRGAAPCTLTLRALHYRDATPVVFELPPGASVEHPWPLRDSHHWYDIAISSSADPAWRRRLAGHVETGRPSRSDPALG
jgi:phospholipase C